MAPITRLRRLRASPRAIRAHCDVSGQTRCQHVYLTLSGLLMTFRRLDVSRALLIILALISISTPSRRTGHAIRLCRAIRRSQSSFDYCHAFISFTVHSATSRGHASRRGFRRDISR